MYTAKMLEKATAPKQIHYINLDAVKNEKQSNMIPGHVRASINWNNSKKQIVMHTV